MATRRRPEKPAGTFGEYFQGRSEIATPQDASKLTAVSGETLPPGQGKPQIIELFQIVNGTNNSLGFMYVDSDNYCYLGGSEDNAIRFNIVDPGDLSFGLQSTNDTSLWLTYSGLDQWAGLWTKSESVFWHLSDEPAPYLLITYDHNSNPICLCGWQDDTSVYVTDEDDYFPLAMQFQDG
jgi:hypothetical protein